MGWIFVHSNVQRVVWETGYKGHSDESGNNKTLWTLGNQDDQETSLIKVGQMVADWNLYFRYAGA